MPLLFLLPACPCGLPSKIALQSALPMHMAQRREMVLAGINIPVLAAILNIGAAPRPRYIYSWLPVLFSVFSSWILPLSPHMLLPYTVASGCRTTGL